MTKKIFIMVVGVLEDHPTPEEVVRASMEYGLSRLTNEEIRASYVDLPEGEGEIFLLPAREVK